VAFLFLLLLLLLFLLLLLLWLLPFLCHGFISASIRTRWEPLWARCLMGPDKDETGLLSVARPLTAQPTNAVTRTRD